MILPVSAFDSLGGGFHGTQQGEQKRDTHDWRDIRNWGVMGQLSGSRQFEPGVTLYGRDAFNENFLVGLGEERFLVERQNGKVQDVQAPGLDDVWRFGIGGCRET